jgi:hypothetical protein
MSINLPFLREVTTVVEEVESIRDEIRMKLESSSVGVRIRGSGRSRILSGQELRQAFQEGRDDAENRAEAFKCPVFLRS